MNKKRIGILLTNIGTPDAPTPSAVRRYLREFLSDPRVVNLPRLLWLPILHGFILRFRPKKSAALYQKIWTDKGSPLLLYSETLTSKLENYLQSQSGSDVFVRLGMRYGHPSVHMGLAALRAQKIDHLFILPLFPQYSGTTTASTFDAAAKTFSSWRYLPSIKLLNQYATDPAYIQAIAESIRQHWQTQGKKYLLFSFHGIPKQYVNLGDPYAELCTATAEHVASVLGINASDWSMAFQSRLGFSPWLKPYTDKVLKLLPQKGITDIDVVCPGFSVDCLETLEEISMRGKEQFLAAGGKSFTYIPALNDTQAHIEMLAKILSSNF